MRIVRGARCAQGVDKVMEEVLVTFDNKCQAGHASKQIYAAGTNMPKPGYCQTELRFYSASSITGTLGL